MNFSALLYDAMFIIPGTVLLAKGILWRLQRHRIEFMHITPISSLSRGLVEVRGRAFAEQNNILQAPFSKKPCLYYAYVLEEYKQPPNSAAFGQWIVLRKGEAYAPFRLRDDNGSVLVYPKNAVFALKKHKEYTTEATPNMHPHLLKFLQDQKVSLTHHGHSRNLRFKEYLIHEGDFVFIVGTAKKENTGQNKEEMDIEKGKQRRFFCITDGDASDVLTEMDWNGVGGIFGGAAAIVVGLLLLFLMMGIPF